MNYRKLLDNPDKTIAQYWGERIRCPQAEYIDDIGARWQALKPRYKSLQADKGACSRRIGEARGRQQDISLLKAEMADISACLAAVEEERKTLEGELERLLAPAEAVLESEWPPQRFAHIDYAAGELPVRIEACGEGDRQAWDDFVARHPQASLYHRYAWRDVIRASFGHETHYWRAIDSQDQTVGILPLVRLTSRLFGDFAVSLPYFNYGGVLSTTQAATDALLAQSAGFAQTAGVSHVELRHTTPLANWSSRTDKASMILPLPDSTAALDKQVGAKVRAQIKQARRYGPSVKVGGMELLDDFYQVFATNMRDLGTPVYSKSFFANILSTWEDQATLVVVRAPRPLAAAFLIGDRNTLEIPWASTIRAANPMNINMLIYWEVLCLAIERGYRYFDFGRSSVDAGTYQFKKQWGARPVQHHWEYWMSPGKSLPRLSPDNPKYRLAIDIWRKLPLAVSTMFGPRIVKYLP